MNTKIKAKDLQELQKNIHKAHKDLGWWDNYRTDTQFFLLFDSELTEAFESIRKGDIKDDHLPQYRGFTVEIADFAIRCLDYLGAKSYSFSDHDLKFGIAETCAVRTSELSFIAFLKRELNNNLLILANSEDSIVIQRRIIANLVALCFEYINDDEHFLCVISEKVSYNKKRSDHKRKNRAKNGGKAF